MIKMFTNISFMSKITQLILQAFKKQNEINIHIKKMINFLQIINLLSHFKLIIKKFIIIFTSIVKTFHEIKTSMKTSISIKTLNILLIINKMSSLC